MENGAAPEQGTRVMASLNPQQNTIGTALAERSYPGGHRIRPRSWQKRASLVDYYLVYIDEEGH